jgi:hypothetical protein
VRVIWSFVYLAVRSLFALIVLLGRSDRSKELEILVLRHELAVLRRRSGHPRIQPADRALLATLSRALPRRAWAAFSVRPETFLALAYGTFADTISEHADALTGKVVVDITNLVDTIAGSKVDRRAPREHAHVAPRSPSRGTAWPRSRPVPPETTTLMTRERPV